MPKMEKKLYGTLRLSDEYVRRRCVVMGLNNEAHREKDMWIVDVRRVRRVRSP